MEHELIVRLNPLWNVPHACATRLPRTFATRLPRPEWGWVHPRSRRCRGRGPTHRVEALTK
jgi:hypothetical protein